MFNCVHATVKSQFFAFAQCTIFLLVQNSKMLISCIDKVYTIYNRYVFWNWDTAITGNGNF